MCPAGLGARRWHTACHDYVETTEIAPTILHLLGLDPSAMQAVRAQGTPVLPHQ